MKKHIVLIITCISALTTIVLLQLQVNQLKATVKQQDDFIVQQKVFDNVLRGVLIQMADAVDQVQEDVEALKNPKGAAQ